MNDDDVLSLADIATREDLDAALAAITLQEVSEKILSSFFSINRISLFDSISQEALDLSISKTLEQAPKLEAIYNDAIGKW